MELIAHTPEGFRPSQTGGTPALGLQKKGRLKMLTIEQKKKWLKALRSGKFLQGMGSLEVSCYNGGKTSYCCLGVLGEVCKIRSSSETFLQDKKGRFVPLPEDLQKKLASKNDNGESFLQIAAWISKNVKTRAARPKKVCPRV